MHPRHGEMASRGARPRGGRWAREGKKYLHTWPDMVARDGIEPPDRPHDSRYGGNDTDGAQAHVLLERESGARAGLSLASCGQGVRGRGALAALAGVALTTDDTQKCCRCAPP